MISGKLVRLTTNAAGTSVTGTTTLIEDWCQQFPSHSLGSLAFGPEGALYVTGGDGASFNGPDYGQLGGTQRLTAATPVNPCGDPPNEGGALRSQDIRTTSDPTGARWRGPPHRPRHRRRMAGQRELRERQRQCPEDHRVRPAQPLPDDDPPATARSGSVTSGSHHWEEIDTIPDPDAAPRNFGWPCREGSGATPQYSSLSLPLCNSLSGASDPAFTYAHSATVDRTTTAGPAAPRSPGSPSARPPATTPPSTTTASSSPTTPAAASGSRPASSGSAAPDFTLDRAVRQPAPLRRDQRRCRLRGHDPGRRHHLRRLRPATRSGRSTTTRPSRRPPPSPRPRPPDRRR